MISECTKDILDSFIKEFQNNKVALFAIKSVDNKYFLDYISTDILTNEELAIFNSNIGFIQKKARALNLIKQFSEKLEQNNVSSFDIEYDATYGGINLRASYCFLDKGTDDIKEEFQEKEITLKECLDKLREFANNPKGKTGLYFKSYGKQKKYIEASANDVINVLENLF